MFHQFWLSNYYHIGQWCTLLVLIGLDTSRPHRLCKCHRSNEFDFSFYRSYLEYNCNYLCLVYNIINSFNTLLLLLLSMFLSYMRLLCNFYLLNLGECSPSMLSRYRQIWGFTWCYRKCLPYKSYLSRQPCWKFHSLGIYHQFLIFE